MCGVAGYLYLDAADQFPEPRSVLARLGGALIHRGPDDSGIWFDARAGIGLAHQRLSIVDLSPAGHQPMVSASGRFVIAFNGEIYNHVDLRRELMQCRSLTDPEPTWHGHSDTETLLAAFEAWGVEATLRRTVGMFAIALWDRISSTVTLARDRLGEKPLYYGWQGAAFLFGSELKALRAHPAFRGEIDRDSLSLLLRHSAIPAPHSIYRGIHKLTPGTFLTLRAGQRAWVAKTYWSAVEAVASGIAQPYAGNDAEAVDELESRLRGMVACQLMSDVPLGAFLSGGVDSSLIVALMQTQSSHPIKTFTMGFNEFGYNESKQAKAVAKHLGTEHAEMFVSGEQARDMIPFLPTIFDEPFADPSQIPTWMLAKLTREHVSVALSGDGGDELFGGYNRHTALSRLWGGATHLPIGIRAGLGRCLDWLPPAAWDHLARGVSEPAEKVRKIAAVLKAATAEAAYLGLISHWTEPSTVVIGAGEAVTPATDPSLRPAMGNYVGRMMCLDAIGYLPDDVLVKVDRAAMSVSLETRAPFLDHRLFEFAWTLPQTMKIRNGRGKWILRQVLDRHVPQALTERPKQGFAVPLDSWLRGPLRPWAENLLAEDRLRREGFFNPAPIRKIWVEHLSGRRNWQYHLWDVLMFQAWLEVHHP